LSATAVSVVTLFPELVQAVTRCGVTGRAIDKQLLSVSCSNPRDFATDRHNTVDDRPFGGGPGMVMMAPPLEAAIDAAAKRHASSPPVIYMSPQGERLNHELVMELAQLPDLILVAGRYEGIDERVVQRRIDREISLGDYVLSGGELAAMVIIDAIARQIPGVLGHEESAAADSFAASGMLDHPHYTRPAVYEGMAVPDVLRSGDHRAIAKWRQDQGEQRTRQRRPDLLKRKVAADKNKGQ
jgi:tRNA (guanine37-N1)-methyltransferase